MHTNQKFGQVKYATKNFISYSSNNLKFNFFTFFFFQLLDALIPLPEAPLPTVTMQQSSKSAFMG